MVEFHHKKVSVSFGDYENEEHTELARLIQTSLENSTFTEGADYTLHIGRGDDIPNGIDLHNLNILQSDEIVALLNEFVDYA